MLDQDVLRAPRCVAAEYFTHVELFGSRPAVDQLVRDINETASLESSLLAQLYSGVEDKGERLQLRNGVAGTIVLPIHCPLLDRTSFLRYFLDS